MGYRIPDTVYDAGLTYAWQNASDRVSFQRAFDEGGPQDQKMSQALITASPLTTNVEIQYNMNQPKIPPKAGYDREPLTVTDVLENDLIEEGSGTNTRVWNDYSDVNSEINSSSIPSIPVW